MSTRSVEYKFVEDLTAEERESEIRRLRRVLRELEGAVSRASQVRARRAGARLDRLCAYEAGLEIGYAGDFRAFRARESELRRNSSSPDA